MAKINLDKLMQDVVSIQNQINGLQMLLSSKKSTIAKYFDHTGERRVDNDECTVYVQEKTKIEYDVDAILKSVDEELTTQFVKKDRSIVDWDGFVKLLKKHNIKPSELRPFVFVTKKVDETVLKKLYERGMLTIEDLSGCYEAKVTKSIVLKMKNIEKEIPVESKGE